MDEQSDLFSQLFVHTLELTSDNSLFHVEKVLDDLLRLNYTKRVFAITSQTAGEILCHLATNTKIITCKNEQILKKYFQLVVHLSSSQELTLDSSAVNSLISSIQLIWNFCIQNSSLLQGLLDAVAAVTYQNGPRTSDENLSFLLGEINSSNLRAIAENSTLDNNVRRTAVQSMAGLCLMLDNGDHMAEQYMGLCMTSFISCLQDLKASTTHDIASCRFIFAVHKGLHNILSSTSTSHSPNIRSLLSVLKKYMVFGLPGHSTLTTADDLQPVPVPDLYPPQQGEGRRTEDADTPQKSTVKDKKKRKKSKQRSNFKTERPRSNDGDLVFNMGQMQLSSSQSSGFRGQARQQSLRPAWAHVTSSESEYSDTEGAQKAKLWSFFNKIRQMCLGVLYLTVRRTDKHTLLGYWTSFLPDSPTLSGNYSSLFTSFRQDTSPKCRAAALGVVGAMCDGSKWFLSLATEESSLPSQTPSFVPFSATLAGSIREIHKQLLSAASGEQSTMALVQLLKTISILVNNTPYHKMRPGLLSKLAALSRHFLANSRDLNVKVTCLTVLTSIVSTNAPLPEVTDLLAEQSPTSESSQASGTLSSDDSQKSWLVNECVLFSRMSRVIVQGSRPLQPQDKEPTETHVNIRVASLQTLTKIGKGYLSAVIPYLTTFSDLICQSLHDPAPPIRLHACKMLEGIGSAMLHVTKTSSVNLEKESYAVWMKLLSGPLQSVLQDHSHSALQGEACDALSTIGPTVFQSLPDKIQILCITLMLGFSSDDNALIRSKSARSLGVYVAYPCLREDITFIEDVTQSVLRLLSDQFLTVRANAAWSLGNVTDTIIYNRETKPSFQQEFQNSLFLSLFKSAIKAMADKDKVRFNMMRVLGNLLRFATDGHVANKQFKPVMLEAVEMLAKMVSENTMVKVRWNACTACSNFLRNTSLPLGDTMWTDKIYMSLCDSLITCRNFKVRIKAALALSTPNKRSHYGSVFNHVFISLIQGLENSKAAADFTEFKFKDTLQDQLCSTLVHLVNIMETGDILPACTALEGKTEAVRQQMVDYHRRITNEIEAAKSKFNSSRSMTPDKKTSPLNSSTSIVSEGEPTSPRLNSSNVSDAIEDYIVVKQLSAEEKLEAFVEAAVWTKKFSSKEEDVNENLLQKDVANNGKGMSLDRKILSVIFNFDEEVIG